MNQFSDEEVITQDLEDLMEILKMRFGSVSPDTLEAIHQITDFATVSRLILVAANSPTMRVFKEELKQGKDSFRIVGDRFNPIEYLETDSDRYGE